MWAGTVEKNGQGDVGRNKAGARGDGHGMVVDSSSLLGSGPEGDDVL